MYIPAFWVGVFATLGSEFIAFIVVPLVVAIIKGFCQQNKRGK